MSKLIFSNGLGMPGQLNVYYDPNDKYHYLMETMHCNKWGCRIETVLEYIRQEGLLCESDCRKLYDEAKNAEWNSLHFQPVDADKLDTLTTGLEITNVETADYPNTDGIILYLRNSEDKSKYVLSIDINQDSDNPPLTFEWATVPKITKRTGMPI